MNNINFLDQYISAPQSVRDFIFSDEYYSYLEEYLRKFEIDPIKETDFVYFLQDLIFKLFVPKSIMELKDEIIRRFNLEETKANQMAYLLFNRFLIIINQIWQEGERLQKEEKISPEISLLIKKIEEVKKKTKPTKILNLQKVITPKSKEKKIIPAINIQKSEEPRVVKIQVPKIETKDLTPPSTMPEISGTKIDIPKIKSENLTPTSWFPKEEKDKKEKEEKEQSTKVVIIKKDQRGQKDEGVVDLSQY